MNFFRKLFDKKPKMDIAETIKSPNGRMVLTFMLEKGRMSYALRRDDKIILRKSFLGLEVKGARFLGANLRLVRMHSKEFEETWETVHGQERKIHNHHREAAFYLEEVSAEKRLLTLRFRVFNDGLAFRYEIPAQVGMRRMIITDELTEFGLDINSSAWQIPAYQPDRYEYNYEKRTLRDLDNPVHTPLTLEAPNGLFIAVHEAALYDYGSMTLKMSGQALKSDITPLSDGTCAHIDLPFATPWRTIIAGSSALDLTMSRMVLNLNEAPKKDFKWVKPTKFMGIWWAMFVGEWTWAPGDRHGATTEHAFEYIDACKRLNIPALLVEGWNEGWEGDWLENGENNKFMQAVPDYDLPKVALYAREKGIDLVGHHETVGFVDNYEAQIEEAYRYMKDLGVRYVKSGYAGTKMTINGRREWHHSQLGVQHYQKAVELAAEHGIMLNIHEPIKSTGIERTWPNILTREGARGQEYEGGALSPSHACILPFTRMLVGDFDYTSGIFDITNFTKRIATTISRQLAYYVTIYSGMQMVSDRPRFYEEKMATFKFIRDVPVSWEKTLPLLGAIGEYYVVARQDRGLSQDWYIGGVNNEIGRRLDIYLDFLEVDTDYVAEIYRDSDDAHYRDHQMGQVIEEKVLDREKRLNIYMAPGGGFAIRLRKR